MLGHHRLIRTLGSGGMGTVYTAEDFRTGRCVALKVMSRAPAPMVAAEDSPSTTRRNKSKDRFVTEVRSMATLEHPNIVTVYTADRTPDCAYYTMQLIDGSDLRELIREAYELKTLIRQPKLKVKDIEYLLKVSSGGSGNGTEATRSDDASVPMGPQSTDEFDSLAEWAEVEAQEKAERIPDEAISDIGRIGPCFTPDAFAFLATRVAEAADAIAYANECGVLHRDIKPSNLLIDRHGKVFVTDFGLAKWIHEDEEESTACVGTLGYMAPECLHAATTVDERSEVYSLGCVLLKLMTLRQSRPPDPTERDWYRSAKNQLPEELYRIIRTAMSVRPGDRYSNVADLVSDLKDFAAGRNAKMARIASAELLDDSADTTTPATRRPRAFAVSVAAIAVALIAVLVLQFRKPRLSEFPNLDGRSDGVASAKTLAVGVPSEDDLDAEFHDIQQLYLEAARDLSASSSKTSAGHRTLSIETQRKLREGAKRCDRLADDVGRTEHSMMRVASLLRKIAFVFDTSGDAFQASEYYGDAAEMLEELDATRPPVFAELCWLRYLQTRRREILQGFASQAFRYAEIAEGAEDMLRTPGLEIAVQSKLHEVVGMIDLARERYRSAATHLLAVQDAEFDQEHVTMALLTAYRMSDQFEKAMPIAIKLVERSPKNHEAWRNLAGLHLHLNEVSEAMSAFQKCVDLDRSNALGWQGLAWAQYRSGEPSLAIESINEAARFSPKNDTILTTRAKFYSGQGRYDEAAADFREALTLRPSSTYVAYPAFVTLAFRSRSDSEDLEFCHDVLRRRPKHWSESMVHQLEAILAFREGRWEDADFFLRKIERPRSPFQIMQVAVDLQLETSAERIDDLKRELEDWQQIHDVTSSDSPLDHLMVRYVFGCTTERWATTDGSF